MKRPVIIAIVGPSGSGKTTMQQYLQSRHGIPAIVSTTTRPKRPEEVEGVDYFFLSDTTIIHRPQDILTKTRFAGYEYFATKSQLPLSGLCTYVVDEEGIRNLKSGAGDEYGVCTVLVRCDTDRLAERGIDPERIERDFSRKQTDYSLIDLIVYNNGTEEEFRQNIDGIHKVIEQWQPLL
jgi:guanylate kinase